MTISISPLSSTGVIANEFRGADIQTMNRHSVIPKASDGIEWRRVRRNENASLVAVFSSDTAPTTSLFQNYRDNPHQFGSEMG
jgi:hypothetical protein